MTGDSFGPQSFKGGEESSCFRALRRCGFTVTPKVSSVAQSLTDAIAEVLSLQTVYSSSNSDAMQRRGELVRNVLPAHLRANIERFEPLFTSAGYSLEVKGSDGIGRKVESPWVRMFDPLMSPSAREGWYLVIHFSRNGRNLYLTVGCAGTVFRDGSLFNLPQTDLAAKVEWARSVIRSKNIPVDRFDDEIQLEGNDLSTQFERATAFAKMLQVEQFTDAEFWEETASLCQILLELYEQDRMGKVPLSEQPEVLVVEAEVQDAISERGRKSTGQGRGLSAAERSAIELRAMELARHALEHDGFTEIKDVSRTESFDFSATRDGVPWLIEVKGTTSPVAESILLTAAELTLHQTNAGFTALVIAHDIHLKREETGPIATGGTVELLSPWSLERWNFEPIAYKARRIRA